MKNPSTAGTFLLRAVLFLLFLSAVINLFYHSHLPTPQNELLHQTLTTSNQQQAGEQQQSPPRTSPYLVDNAHSLLWKGQAQQVVKKDRQGKLLHHNIHALRKEDLKGLGDDDVTNTTLQEASQGREPLLAILKDAGVTEMDAASIAKLPTWQQVVNLYGEGPVVYGLDSCADFRAKIPLEDASIGTAGLFNTGTNPFAMYLSANCQMPQNKHDRFGGMRWQVPWGKHMLASRKWTNTAKHDTKVNKTNVLPVVLVREPLSWMQSMCRHPYAAKFVSSPNHCPILVPTRQDLQDHTDELAQNDRVVVNYPHPKAHFPSLAHFWSQWYNEYLQADYPRLIARFEDLIFHPKQLLSVVCECAGAVPKQDAFQYVVGEAKWGSKVHEGSSNMISAMIRYGNAKQRLTSLTADDLRYAMQHLDSNLMNIFQYQVPDVREGQSTELLQDNKKEEVAVQR